MTDEDAKLIHDLLWAGEKYLVALVHLIRTNGDAPPGYLDKPRQRLITAIEAIVRKDAKK